MCALVEVTPNIWVNYVDEVQRVCVRRNTVFISLPSIISFSVGGTFNSSATGGTNIYIYMFDTDVALLTIFSLISACIVASKAAQFIDCNVFLASSTLTIHLGMASTTAGGKGSTDISPSSASSRRRPEAIAAASRR